MLLLQTSGSPRAQGHTERSHDRVRVHVDEQPRRYTTSCKQSCQVQCANPEAPFEHTFREVRAAHLLLSRSRYRSQSSMMFSKTSCLAKHLLARESPKPYKPCRPRNPCRDAEIRTELGTTCQVGPGCGGGSASELQLGVSAPFRLAQILELQPYITKKNKQIPKTPKKNTLKAKKQTSKELPKKHTKERRLLAPSRRGLKESKAQIHQVAQALQEARLLRGGGGGIQFL